MTAGEVLFLTAVRPCTLHCKTPSNAGQVADVALY
jgi:hypothetical protein